MTYCKLSPSFYVALVWGLRVSAASAQQLSPEQFQLIKETAESICDTVKEAKGKKSDVQIQGDVKAQLNGLIGKVVDVGASGKGSITRKEFEGLSQEATAIAMEVDRGCRERIFNKMFDKVGTFTQSRLGRGDARFGTNLGWQLARYEFAYGSAVPEAKAAAPSIKQDIIRLLRGDNAVSVFNDDFKILADNILAHYMAVSPARYDAILIGIAALRASLVGASRNPEDNLEMSRLAFSTIRDVDSSVIGDKKGGTSNECAGTNGFP
jgi:hypothetical protein